MWAKAVWLEEGQEVDGTVPSVWINGDTSYWPNAEADKHAKKQSVPESSWLKFQLVKIKHTSGKDFKEYMS